MKSIDLCKPMHNPGIPAEVDGNHIKGEIGTFCGLNYVGLLAEEFAARFKIGIIDLDTHYSGMERNIILLDFYTALFDKAQPDYPNVVKVCVRDRKDFIKRFKENLVGRLKGQGGLFDGLVGL